MNCTDILRNYLLKVWTNPNCKILKRTILYMYIKYLPNSYVISFTLCYKITMNTWNFLRNFIVYCLRQNLIWVACSIIKNCKLIANSMPCGEYFTNYCVTASTTCESLSSILCTISGYLSGNASLHLSVEGSTGAKWWTIQRYEDGGGTKDYLNITSFNERIAPAGVLSVLSNYG